eukprot:scaffold15942_cov74-Phaeocystis_antarctica.AAC.5
MCVEPTRRRPVVKLHVAVLEVVHVRVHGALEGATLAPRGELQHPVRAPQPRPVVGQVKVAPTDAGGDLRGTANDLAVGGDNRVGQLVRGVTGHRGVHLALLGRVEARRLRPAQRLCRGADLLAVIDSEPLQAHRVEEGAVAEVAERRDEHLAALAGHVHREEARRVDLHHQAVESRSRHVAAEQDLHVLDDLLDLAGGAVVDEVSSDLELRGLVQLIVTHF